MKNVTIPSQFLQELLALCGPEDHELRERVLKSAAPAHPAEGVPDQNVQPVLGWIHKLRNGKIGSKFYTYEPHCDCAVRDGGGEKIAVVAATHPTQQVLDARTAYEAECFRWLRDEALKVWKKGPVVFMTDADGCPGDGGAWSDNILSGKKLERAIPVAAQAKQGEQP